MPSLSIGHTSTAGHYPGSWNPCWDGKHSWGDSIDYARCMRMLQFNTQKCKFMRVTRKRTGIRPPTLHFCCWPLQEVDSYKYLGILLSSDLSWTQHIQSTCGKVRKLIDLIYRHFYQCSNSESLFQMYISLVRLHLEYANQVWNPYKTGEINSLEDVQKFALWMCAKHWDSLWRSIQLFTQPSLQQCRLYSTMFKIVHGLLYFPSGVSVEQAPRLIRLQSHQ